MDPFAQRPLGRSGLSLPALGFGGAPLGELYVRVSDQDAEATLAASWNAGIRYYDTAPWYGRGQSEHRLGALLRRQRKEDFLISTKVGRLLKAPHDLSKFNRGQWIGGLDFDVRWDFSYDGIMRSYEDSLQRLGMNRVDLLIIHDLDWWHHRTDAKVDAYLTQLATSGYRALDELKRHELIRAIGAGVNELRTIPRFLDVVDLDFFMLALRYTLAEQDALDEELPICEGRGVGIVVAGVYNSGLYATGPQPGVTYNYAPATDEQLRRVARVESICLAHRTNLAAAALQFPLHHPLVASVIPGALSPEQAVRNLNLFREPIPPALWDELKHEKLLHPEAPVPSGNRRAATV